MEAVGTAAGRSGLMDDGTLTLMKLHYPFIIFSLVRVNKFSGDKVDVNFC